MLAWPPLFEIEYRVWSVPSALRTKGDLSPLTSTVYSPVLLLATVFSWAGSEESLTETVAVPAVSNDATPKTVDLEALDAVGESSELTPQPLSARLKATAHDTRIFATLFLIFPSSLRI